MPQHRGVARRASYVGAGWWCRASRYEISGRHIRPIAGARLEWYDPWEDYERAPGGKSPRRDAPYLSLAEIDAPPQPGESASRTLEQWQGVLARAVDWSNRFGLLGILRHRVLWVETAARWEPPTADSGRLLHPSHSSAVRIGAGWLHRTGWAAGTDVWYIHDEPEKQGALVPDEMRPSGWRPRTILTDPEGLTVEASLADSWGSFFPGVPRSDRETFDYLSLHGEDFWRQYAEPIDDFLQVAHSLRGILNGLDDPKQRNEWLALKLDRLVQVMAPTPIFENAQLQWRWGSPSLIGHLGMMLLVDNSKGRRPLRCDCGALFLSAAHQGRYCSESCRWRFQKRRLRTRQTRRRHR